MTRVAVCGAAFDDAVEVLGLERVDELAEVVLVDLADPEAVGKAAEIAPDVPRVAIARAEQERLLRAAGCAVPMASSAAPEAIGPLVAAAVPARRRGATRLVVVTGPSGGAGRTLLVAGLAARLSARASVLVLDATGSGSAAWWLRLAPGSWSDLEGLVEELTTEHLAVVAAERERLRVIGGVSPMPSVPLLAATARAAVRIADVVLVDAPALFDERTRALIDDADRVLVVSTDDPAALSAIDASIDEERVWWIASRCRAERLGAHPTFRALPDDPAAVRAAVRGPSIVGGALGRAYDELAEILTIDIA